MENKLRCFFNSDLLPWERQSFSSILERLRQEISVEVTEIDASHRRALSKVGSGPAWIIARDWRSAVKFLGVRNHSKTPVFVSVMDLSSPRENIYKVLLNKLVGSVPESVTLLVHSPLNYRFFTELEGFSNSRVRFLPLPLPNTFAGAAPKSKGTFSVGSFGPFVSDSHLNYVVSVAHYLIKKNEKITFKILGTGPLYAHISQMISDLSLSSRVSVVETVNPELISELDVLLYSPLRNDHFLPLYFAGMAGLPVVASEVPGVTDYIKDGHSGFVVPVNETKSMGELILRLAGDSVLATSMGQKLKETLAKSLNTSVLVNDYLSTFIPGQVPRKNAERAA